MSQDAQLGEVDLITVENLPVLSGGLVQFLDFLKALLVKGLLDMPRPDLLLPDNLPLNSVGQVVCAAKSLLSSCAETVGGTGSSAL